MEPIATEMDIIIIIIIIITVLSGRKRRRQVHYWLYSQFAFCDKKTTNTLHHAGKRDAKIWLEKQLPFCVMCCYPWSCDTRKRGNLCLNQKNSVEKTIVDLMSVHRWSLKVQSTVAVFTVQLAHVWTAHRELVTLELSAVDPRTVKTQVSM